MQEPTNHDPDWFAVRCVLHHRDLDAYEERITLWQAANFDEAVALAEEDARDYVGNLVDSTYAGLAQAYHLFDEPRNGAEIFSLMRDSTLAPADYLTSYFDTGAERQQNVEDA